MSFDSLKHVFLFPIRLIKGKPEVLRDLLPRSTTMNKEYVEEKVFPFKLALTALLSQREEKAFPWWKRAPETENKACCAFLYIQILVFSKIDNSLKKKKRIEDLRKDGRESTDNNYISEYDQHSRTLHLLFLIFPQVPKVPSVILYLWSIIEPWMALMVWNVPKCSSTAGDVGSRQENHPIQVSFALEANGQLWPRQI